MTTLNEAVEHACRKSTLAEALKEIATWETKRAVEQANTAAHAGVPTGIDGVLRYTCFKICFDALLKRWNS